MGSLSSARSGAQKCLSSCALCARMLCSRRVRSDKDWIAQGGNKAQGALGGLVAQSGVIPGGLFAQSSLSFYGSREASLRRVLSLLLPKAQGGLSAQSSLSFSRGSPEASLRRVLSFSPQGSPEASLRRVLSLLLRSRRPLCAELSLLP